MHGLADQLRSGQSLSLSNFDKLSIQLRAETDDVSAALSTCLEWCTASHERMTIARSATEFADTPGCLYCHGDGRANNASSAR